MIFSEKAHTEETTSMELIDYIAMTAAPVGMIGVIIGVDSRRYSFLLGPSLILLIISLVFLTGGEPIQR